MTAITAPAPSRRSWLSSLGNRQLDFYPDTGLRLVFLGITVLATIMLYYELYVGGSVSTALLQNLGITFSFYVRASAVGSLIGAFGSLFAGLTDRFGRANLVVFGLLFTGVFVAFIIPGVTTKWPFIFCTFVVGFVEGTCLVATPALIRDFSPQLGRATAMGFWTVGPVVGSLIVSVVGSNTLPAVIVNTHIWTHEYKICGVAGLVVFVIAFLGLRELSPQLRDQLMVTMRDRALIEARAKGLDIAAALRHPFRQLMKADIIVSAIAVSVMLLIYYTAVGFLVIFLDTVFGISLKNANGLGNWEWGANVVGLVLIGMLSDRLRVRKPLMVIGGIGGAVMIVIYIAQIGGHPSYYTLAAILAITSIFLGIAYCPWMASFTETVEARNPALTATGLAIWGWIIRLVVAVSTFCIPLILTSVTPLVEYGSTALTYEHQYSSQIAWAEAHPKIVAEAQKYSPALANTKRFAPEIAMLESDQALFVKLLYGYSSPSQVPPKLLKQAIGVAGGGATGTKIVDTFFTHSDALQGIAENSAKLTALTPYTKQLTALSKVPSNVFPFLEAHATTLETAQKQAPGQWREWYWVCFGGVIFFILCVPLLRGRWRPSDAKRDEDEHEAMVQAEMAKLGLAEPEAEPAT